MNDLLSSAIRLLSQRDHSEAELRRKLAARPFVAKTQCGGRVSYASTRILKASIEPDIIEQIIAYCYHHNWLDAQYFALSYISSRCRKGYGMQRIYTELAQKGVDKKLV